MECLDSVCTVCNGDNRNSTDACNCNFNAYESSVGGIKSCLPC